MATAVRLMQLQQSIERSLPEPLDTACQVLKWQDETLTLGVPTAAHSAKLRQLLPRLANRLQADGWQVNQIRVRIQARPLQLPHTPRHPPRDIPPEGLRAFAELQGQLREGPLADAVRRLVGNRLR